MKPSQAELSSSQAKPSQASPRQFKPSQAKLSFAWKFGATASMPYSENAWMAAAAPPESASMTTGMPLYALWSTVASVPGPPLSTTVTVGTRSEARCASSRVRNNISEPQAFAFSEPLSTRIKWVCAG